MQSNLGFWITASRPYTLPLATSTVILGSGLAAHHQVFTLSIGVACLTFALLMQILSNFANDYGDALRGVDNEKRLGPDRMVGKGNITPVAMRKGLILNVILCVLNGVVLLFLSPIAITTLLYLFIPLGILCGIAAMLYTMGKRPYGYYGLGDVAAFLFFGPVPVLGTYILMGGTMMNNWNLLLPACAAGLGSTAILNINNIRDQKNDKECGKKTFATFLGNTNALNYHLALIGFILLFFCLYILPLSSNWVLFILILSLPLIYSTYKVYTYSESAKLNQELKRTFLCVSLLSSVLGILLFL